MSQTLEKQLNEFKGHGRLSRIADLMTVFSDTNAEKIYDGLISLENHISEKETVKDFIELLINPNYYYSDTFKSHVEDLKVREKEITSEVLEYFTRINQYRENQKITFSTKDLIYVLKENIKFNNAIIVT